MAPCKNIQKVKAIYIRLHHVGCLELKRQTSPTKLSSWWIFLLFTMHFEENFILFVWVLGVIGLGHFCDTLRTFSHSECKKCPLQHCRLQLQHCWLHLQHCRLQSSYIKKSIKNMIFKIAFLRCGVRYHFLLHEPAAADCDYSLYFLARKGDSFTLRLAFAYTKNYFWTVIANFSCFCCRIEVKCRQTWAPSI